MAKTFKRLQKPEEKTISFDSPAVIKEDNVFFAEDSPLGKAESFGQSLKRTLIPPGSFGTAGGKFEETIPDDYLSEKEIDNIAYDAKIAAAMRSNIKQEDEANRVFGTSVGGLVTEGYARELAAGMGFPAGAFASTVTALGGGSLIDLLYGELTEGREDKGRAVAERIRSYMAESQRSQVRYPRDYKGNRPFKNIMSDEAFNTWKRSSIQALAQAPLMASAPLIGWEGVVGTHVFGQTYDSYEEYVAAGGSKSLGMLYGLSNGIVEYGVTKAFQSIGLAGLEQAFKAGKATLHPAKKAMMQEVAARGLLSKFGITAKGTPAALASFASTATPEAVEETMIAVMQNSLRSVSGLDPNAADFENQWKAAVDATVTSMLMTGSMNTAALARGTWNKETQQWTPDADAKLRDVDQSPLQAALNDPTGGIPVVGELNLGLDLTQEQRSDLEEDFKKSRQQDVEQSEKQVQREEALAAAESVSNSLNEYTEEVTDANGDVVEVESPADVPNVRVTLNTDGERIEYDIVSYMLDENKLKLIDDNGNIKFSKVTDVSLTEDQVKKNIDNSDILSPVPEGTRSVFGRAATEPDPTVDPVLNDNTETIQDKIDAATKENMTPAQYLDYLTQRRIDQGEDLEQPSVFIPDDAESADRSVFDVAGRDRRLDAQEAQEQYEALEEYASRNDLPEEWLQENDPRREDSVFNQSNEAPVQPDADPLRDVIQLQEEAKDVKSVIERTKRNAEAAIRQEIEERFPVESYTPVSQQYLERIIRDRLEQQFLMFSQNGTDIESLSLKLQQDIGATDAEVRAALIGLQSQGLAQVDSGSNKVLPSKKFVDKNRTELQEGEVGEVSEGRTYAEYVVEQNPINTDLLAFDLDQTGDATRLAKTKDGPIAVNIQRNEDGSHTVTLTKPEKFKSETESFDADTSSEDVAKAAVGMLHKAIEFHGLPDHKSPQRDAELNDPNEAGWESYFEYLGSGLARSAGRKAVEAAKSAAGVARGAAQDVALTRPVRRVSRAVANAYRNTIEFLTGKKKRPDGTISYKDFLEAVKTDKGRGFNTILDEIEDLNIVDSIAEGLSKQPWYITPEKAGVTETERASDEAQEQPPQRTDEEVQAAKARDRTIAKRFMEALSNGMKFEDFIRAQEFGFEGTLEDLDSGLLTEEQLGQLSMAIGTMVDLDMQQQQVAEPAPTAEQESEVQQQEAADTTQDTEVEEEPVSEVQVEDEAQDEEEVTPPSGEKHDIFMKLFTNNEAGGFRSSSEPVYIDYEDEGTYEVLNYRPTDGQMTIVDEDGVDSTWNIMDGDFSIVSTEQTSDEPAPEDVQEKKPRTTRAEGVVPKPQPRSNERKAAILKAAKEAAAKAAETETTEDVSTADDASPQATPSVEVDAALNNVLNSLKASGFDIKEEDSQGRDFSVEERGQAVRDSLIEYMFDRQDNQVPLDGILSELSGFLQPEQFKSLVPPLRAAWDVINSASESPITEQQIDAAFQPYEGTANVQPNADGLESGQGGTGVGSKGGSGDSSARGSTGDTVGGVPESDGDQARAGGGERGLRRRSVQTDVAADDRTSDSTRRRRLGDRSPDDATVSGLPDGDAEREGGRLSDEDPAERRSERRSKFNAELRSVSRQDFSGDVASVPYENVSGQIVDKILVPTNHADAVASNMRKIQDRYYYLPNFVAKETGLDQTSLENFSAMYDYQLEGVAAAIAAHKRGESYILGWQTGIGKGRVVASVMQYARKQGLLPVFVTDRPDLFSSMMEDTYNIGAIKEDGDFVPFITNNASESAAIDLNANIEGFGERKQVQNKSQSESSMERMAVRKGKLVDGNKKYDAIFTTYDQMRPSKGLTYRNNFINNIAERAFFILDESHKIGEGRGRNADGTERLSTGSFLRDAIAASRGALFSSATFSKTSDQTKTYVTAGLEKSLDDPTQLGDLLSSMGDAGLQIFSQGLADNGTYSRLERDMADVEVTTKQVTTVPEQVDAISQSLASLQDAQAAIKSVLKSSIEKIEAGLFETDASSFIVGLPDGANKGKLKDYTKPSETSGIPFVPTKLRFIGSPQHQDVITTAITAMKVEAAADDIITQVKAGKKVVAVFDSTMESALNKFVQLQGIGTGSEVNFNLKSVLLQQIEEARKVEVLFERKTVDENGDRIKNKRTGEPLLEKRRVNVRLEDIELSKEALAAIDKARSLINSLPDDLSGSPIDGVAKRLTEEGIEFAELTGRKRVIDYSSGKPVYAARKEGESGAEGKKKIQDRFNSEPQLKVLLANRSIATGMNLQASFGFADQSQRHMTIIEIAKDINALMQLLGRINRANQSSIPTYSFMLTDSPTEIRLASMFSKKMRSLSASVSADGESSINPDMPDYMNFVGEYVLSDVLLQMKHEGIDLLEQMGRTKGLVLNGQEAVLKQREGDLNFFNEITAKMSFLPIAAQNEVWSRMERAYQSELESLAMAGDSPLKAKLYDFKAKTLDFEVVKAPRNAAAKEGVFGSGVRLQRVSAKNDGGILTEYAIEKRIADALNGREPAQFTAELMDTINKEHDSYMEDRTARIAEIGIDAEERVKELNTSASSRMNIIQSVLGNPVGAHVVLTTKTRNPSNGQLENYNVPAVILEHVRRGQSEDPANLSDFYVRVAVPDERGVAQISYEQISQGRFAIGEPSLTRKDTLKVFTDKTKGGRIQRYIATGDVVAALEQFKGYGVPGFYTNDRGEQRAGVILHRDFDPEIWRENRPASISNPNSAAMALVEGIPLRFLDGKAQITGRSDGLHIQMPFEAKGNGVSKIKKSLEDAGLRFGKNEDGLTAFINKPYSKDRLWESVAKRIIDNAGGSVVAARNHSLAREIIRDVEGLDDPRVMDGRDLFRSSRRRKKDQPLAAEELNPHTDARREINFWNEVTTGGQVHVNNKDAEDIIVQSKSVVNSLATIFDLKNWEGGVAGRDVHAWYQGAKKHQKYGTGEIVTAKHASARIGVRLHEIAHALDDRYLITKEQLTEDQLEKIKYLDPSIARVEEGTGRVREGWAEFVRRMFTQSSVNPEDVRIEFAERYGNFDLQEFMDEMTNWMADFANKKENSALKKQLQKARKLMNAYRDQPLVNKLDSMINVQPVDDLALSPVERASRWAAGLGRKVMFHFNDDLNEVMRFDRASVNSVNANRIALEDLVASKRHQANEQGRLAQILGVFDPNTNEMISSSGVISDFHGGIQSFFDMKAQIAVGQNKRQQIQYKNRAKVFAWARHVAWLADQEWAQDYEAGMGVEEAVAFMNEIKKDPEMYNDYIKMAEEISDQGLKYLKVAERTGGLDPNMYRFLYKRYHESKNYFPMYRIRNQENSLAMDLSASGINFTKQPLKGRSRYGSGDPVEDPLVSLESMAVDVYHKSAQTTITQEIYSRLDSGLDAGLGQFARVRDKSTKITQQRMEDIVKQLVDRGIISDSDASMFKAAHRMRQGLEKIGYKLGDAVTAPVVSARDMNKLALELGFNKNDSDLPTKLARVGFVPSAKLPSLEGFVSTFTQVYDKPRNGEELRVVWVPVGVDPMTGETVRKEVQVELIPEFAESLSSLKPIERNVFYMFMGLGYQSIRTAATGTFSFFVKDLPRNISSALTRTDIKESPYLPFYNTLKGTIKEFYNRYGVELARRIASKVPVLNQTGWIKPPTELQDMDSLYVLMEKQGGSAFTKLGSFVKGSRSRKRVERSLMSVPLDSRSTALDMIFNGGAKAGLLQALKSPDGDAINLKGVTLERVLSGMEKLKDVTTDKMANYFDAMQRFANASDKPTRLTNARNKLNELGYTALTGNSFINPDGDKVSGLPRDVMVAVIAAYQSGGLNHIRGGRFTRHTSRYVNFLNTNWHSVITDAVLMKRGALDPLAEKLLPEKVSRRIVGKRKQGLSDAKARHMTILAAKYLPLMAYSAALAAMYRLFNDEEEHYENAPEKRKDGAWLLGSQGKTLLEIRKSSQFRPAQDLGIYLAESFLESERSKGRGSLGEIMLENTKAPASQLGSSFYGGPAGILLQIASNETYFETPITPSFMQSNFSPTQQFLPNTRLLSRKASEIGYGLTGLEFLTPLNIDHFMEGMTARLWGWGHDVVGGTFDQTMKMYDVATGEKRMADYVSQFPAEEILQGMPMLGTAFPYRTEVEPIYSLQAALDEQQTVVNDHQQMGMSDSESARIARRESAFIDKFNDLVKGLNQLQHEMGDGKEEIKRLAVGTARQALGLRTQDNFQSVLTRDRDSLPKEVVDVVDQFLDLTIDRTLRVSARGKIESSDVSLIQQKLEYLEHVDNVAAFVREISDMPYVSGYLRSKYTASRMGSLRRSLASKPEKDGDLNPHEQRKYNDAYNETTFRVRRLLKDLQAIR